MILPVLKNANLALAFLLELGVLAALGYWGFQTGQGLIAKIALGIGAPLIAVVVWGIFGAPKSAWQLKGIPHWTLQVVFFGSAAVALFISGQRILGVAFALISVLNHVLLYTWDQ